MPRAPSSGTHTTTSSSATPSSSMSSFSELSLQLTSSLSKEEKKNGGIFFTPQSCIQRIITLLQGVSITIRSILEPSCGSGEFITVMCRAYPDADITGVEFHPTIYEAVSQKFAGAPRAVRIQHGDFLKYDHTGPSPDLIIGNPPYFVMKKEEVAAEYYPYFDGRPNIFVLFIIKCAKLVRAGGVLCFVLPSSFMNSQYYDKTRKYIVRNFAILHIVRCDTADESRYIDTAQDTIILILQKNYSVTVTATATATTRTLQCGGVYEKSGATIFTDNLPKIMSLYKDSRSLHDLGFKVTVGTVVWNQCKDALTADATKTRLVYSANIENGAFVHKTYKNPEKKAFINKPGIRTPMIVLNRGYGVGEYQFDYCLLTPESSSSMGGNGAFLIENHLICITPVTAVTAAVAAFDRIIRSFQDPRTQEFISCYFGNNAVNTTELNHMLPIYEI